jgi:hypothetical protein
MSAAVETTPAETSTEAAASRSACNNRSACNTTATVVAIGAVSVESGPVETTSVEAVVPRASTDKDSTNEPSRTVIAVRRARIGIVAVVTVCTCWRGSDVSWADCDANRNPGVG